MMNFKSKAIGLLELMLSLAVIAIIILTAARYFVRANYNAHVTQTVQMARTLIEASFEWEKGQADFTKVSVPELVNKGFLSADWGTSSGVILKKNPWGGSVSVDSGSIYCSDNNKVAIGFAKIPEKACNDLDSILRGQNVSGKCTGAGDDTAYTGCYPGS